MPKVSVLIPVFNRRHFIADCIQSALDQTYTDFEVIVVDNASDDGTWEICQRFLQVDSRVQIFRNATNVGPLKNILLGVNNCKGEYVKILFSDDLMANTCLEKMVFAMKENPMTAMVITNASQLINNKIIENMRYNLAFGKILSSNYIKSALFENEMPLSPGACLFRREDICNNYLGSLNSPNDRKVEDHGAGPDLLSMLLTAASYKYVYFIDEPLNIFREHEESISISKSGYELSDCYVQAKINFSIDYFPRKELLIVLAKIYIYRCLGYKVIMMPLKFMKTFGIKLTIFEKIKFNIIVLKLIVKKISSRFVNQ